MRTARRGGEASSKWRDSSAGLPHFYAVKKLARRGKITDKSMQHLEMLVELSTVG